MSFHVRLQRHVLFTEETYNLSEPELRRRFIEPWLAGTPIIIKGRTWVPERSRIVILEGPDLTSTQRSWVQGWTKAIELSENVTDRFLHPPPIPVGEVRSAAGTVRTFDNAHASDEHHEHRYVGSEKQPPIVTHGPPNEAMHAAEIKLLQGWSDIVHSWESTR
jgi:hypothetical protein